MRISVALGYEETDRPSLAFYLPTTERSMTPSAVHGSSEVFPLTDSPKLRPLGFNAWRWRAFWLT